MTSLINWGIIGAGNIAHSFANDFKFTAGGRILAAASRNAEKASAFCKKYDIERAYSNYTSLINDQDIDIVYIATPHNFHFEQAAEAIQAGKAVLCEKPICISSIQCNKLIQLAKSNSVFLMEAMWTYFLLTIHKAQKWISDGEIGDLKLIKADFAFKADFDPRGRLFNPDLAGGALLDIGIYPIAFTWLFHPQFPADVNVRSKKAETGVDSEENILFEYENGLRAQISASLNYKLPNEALLVGTEGYIRIPEFFMSRECFLYKNDKLVDKLVDHRKSIGYQYEIESVQNDLKAKRIQSTTMPLSTSLNILKIMESVKKHF